MAGIVERVAHAAPPGTVIPKPDTSQVYRVKGWGKRRDEDALIDLITSDTNPARAHEKGVTSSELIAAHERLLATGELSRAWYRERFPKQHEQAPCNFTTISGLFQLLGLARYEPGLYLLAHPPKHHPASTPRQAGPAEPGCPTLFPSSHNDRPIHAPAPRLSTGHEHPAPRCRLGPVFSRVIAVTSPHILRCEWFTCSNREREDTRAYLDAIAPTSGERKLNGESYTLELVHLPDLLRRVQPPADGRWKLMRLTASGAVIYLCCVDGDELLAIPMTNIVAHYHGSEDVLLEG